jgi:hypothetical protein
MAQSPGAYPATFFPRGPRARRRPARGLAALGIAGFLAAGCAGAPLLSVRVASGLDLEADAVAIYPVTADFPLPPVARYAKTQDLVASVAGATSGRVIGPEEFELRAPEAPPAIGSTLPACVSALGLDPERVLVLRVEVSRGESRTQALVNDESSGRCVGRASGWSAAYSLRITLTRLAQLVPSAEGSVSFREDVSDRAAGPETDLYPRWTAEMRRAIPALFSSLAAQVRVRPAAHRRVELADAHRRLFALPELAGEMAGLTGLDRDLREMAVYRHLYPDMPARWLARMRQAAEGVLVVAPGGIPSLRADDLVVAVAGRPVAGLAAVVRALADAGPVRLEVVRDGQRLAVEVPAEKR